MGFFGQLLPPQGHLPVVVHLVGPSHRAVAGALKQALQKRPVRGEIAWVEEHETPSAAVLSEMQLLGDASATHLALARQAPVVLTARVPLAELMVRGLTDGVLLEHLQASWKSSKHLIVVCPARVPGERPAQAAWEDLMKAQGLPYQVAPKLSTQAIDRLASRVARLVPVVPSPSSEDAWNEVLALAEAHARTPQEWAAIAVLKGRPPVFD